MRDQAALAARRIFQGQDLAQGRLVGEIVDPRAGVDDRPERGMARHVLDPLALDPDRAAVAQAVPIGVAGPEHQTGRGTAVPIRQSRVTSAASASSLISSVPGGRIGRTR